MNQEPRYYRHLIAKAKHEILSLMDRAQKRILLSNTIEEDIHIQTIRGNILILENSDLKKLKQNIPIYLHDKLELPLELTIIDNNPLRFKIEGDLWQKRMINYILKGKLEWRPNEILGEPEVSQLLREYRSLIHIMLKGME